MFTNYSNTKAKAKRLKAFRAGHRAELFACITLMFKGYRILVRRYRTPVGEVDIIARRGTTIVGVEVKYRQRYTDAAESLALRQQRRIERGMSYFLARYPDLHYESIRFDVMLLSPKKWPHHIKNAWT